MIIVQNTLMWISAVAAGVLSVAGFGVWCDRHQVFPGRRLLGAFRSLPWSVQFFLLAFSLHMVVHGSIKTNSVGGVEGTAQQWGRDILVACNKAASAMFSRDRNVASPLYEIQQPEAGRVPANAELAQNWWRRGCWDDWRTVTFEDGWVFPHGSNHLSQVAVMSQGEIRSSVCDTLPVASLGARVAHVPFDTCFYHEHTPSNSYRFVWNRAYIERNTNMPMTAAVELFRNGDTCVTTNGVSTVTPYEIPFPHIGIGQDDDWVRANFTNATDILAVGYADWVDAQVGVDLENGLYKFTATFPDDPPGATELIVGDKSVCVTNAGEYVFVLEKGVEYDFGTNPYDPTVEYSMQDDVMGTPVFANGWWGDDNGVWTVDGDWHELYLPWLTYFGSCYWEPKFRGAPDVTNLSTADFPMTFTALLTDCCHTNGVTYRWSTDDENVRIVSPSAQTTQVELDSSFDAETFSLAVEAYATGRTYYSTLTAVCSTNAADTASFSMPDVVFVNNDDDNGDGQPDAGPQTLFEDDVVCGTVAVPQSEDGVLALVGIDGFVGDVYEETATGFACVSAGANWRISSTDPDREKRLYFDGLQKSAGYRSSTVRLRWTPDEGRVRNFTHRFTVVEPIVEPICKETINVVENGVVRKLVVNPCGVGIGRDAYFSVEVLPRSFPDSKIVWSAVGEGSVAFPDGNTGRAVRVHGLGAGEVGLQVQIGDCESRAPSFSLRVVENRVVKLSAWILIDRDGAPVRTVDSVRELVKQAEDIYSQVGVTFDLADRVVVTNMDNTADIARGGERRNMISFTNLVNVAHGTGGIELYFVNDFYNVTNGNATLSKVVGVNRTEGLAVAKSATATTLAHEIGHAFGLDDIYVMKQSLSVGGLKTRCSFGRLDWNDGCDGSGDGGARYYPFGTLHKDIIGCLLMNGDCGDETLGGSDLTYGRIYGVVKKSSGNAYADAEVGWFVSASEGVVEHE